jgi:hypothetical protein
MANSGERVHVEHRRETLITMISSNYRRSV